MGVLDLLNEKTLFVVDANCILYKTWHALSHQKGEEPTEGLLAYSYMSQIRSYLSKYIISPNVVTTLLWDPPDSKVGRLKIFPEYKGGRKSGTAEFHAIQDSLQEALGNLRPRLNIEYPGIEADDAISVITQKRVGNFDKYVICSRDEDLMQLIDDKVSYFNPFSKKTWNLERFRDKYGFEPPRLSIYKAIVGDDSDNWKGVVGKGPKFAQKWLSQDIPDRELVTNLYEQFTDEQKERFLIGLNLCHLPWKDADKFDIAVKVHQILSEEPEADWFSFYDKFEIMKPENVHFNLGRFQ